MDCDIAIPGVPVEREGAQSGGVRHQVILQLQGLQILQGLQTDDGFNPVE